MNCEICKKELERELLLIHMVWAHGRTRGKKPKGTSLDQFFWD